MTDGTGIASTYSTPPPGLSTAEREQIRSLALDLPALWQAPGTRPPDRQRIVRLLVEEVVVTVRGDSEWVEVTIRSVGGSTKSSGTDPPVQRYQQLANYGQSLNRIDELRKAGHTLAEVAQELNGAGFRPPKRSPLFHGGIVARLLAQRRRSRPRPRAVAGDKGSLNLNDSAIMG